MWSCVWSLMLPVFIREKKRVVGWASSVFAKACIALICHFVLRLFMFLLVQHDSSWSCWRYVSFWWDVHRLHVGDMSCPRMCFFLVVS